MKKKKAKATYSEKPPAGWPSEADWKEVDGILSKAPATRIIPFSDMTTVEKIKQSLCSEFVRYKSKNKIKQKELAELLNISESRMSEILHYHFGHYTVDRLLGLLIIIKPEATLKLIA